MKFYIAKQDEKMIAFEASASIPYVTGLLASIAYETLSLEGRRLLASYGKHLVVHNTPAY